jgi:hypothetical protein
LIAALSLLLLSSASLASQPPESGDAGSTGSTAVEQITLRSQVNDPIVANHDLDRASGREPVAQIGVENRSAAAPGQLSSVGDRRRSPQLYQGGRTAAAAQPLSSPSQGRTGAVSPVGGTDSCDPARRRPNDSSRCSKVIETRSAEFNRAEAAPLSPEARLLVEQRNRVANGQGAARRLANNSADPDNLQDQAVASVALTQRGDRPAEEEVEGESSAPAEAQAFQAIIEGIVGSPPPP